MDDIIQKHIIFIKMTQHLTETMKKSLDKSQKATNGNQSMYDKCRAIRPFILNILRHFDDLEGDIKWSEFLRVAYTKATRDFLPALDAEISELEELSQIWYCETGTVEQWVPQQTNYLKKFRKNLLKLKKKCEDSSIGYYNYLPGYKLPLEIRRHIIGFISPTN